VVRTPSLSVPPHFTIGRLTIRDTITPPRQLLLDLRNVNYEKQQRAKQLLDSHSVQTAGLLVQYQAGMKGLTRYVFSHEVLEMADKLVYRCFQRARVMRRMYVREV